MVKSFTKHRNFLSHLKKIDPPLFHIACQFPPFEITTSSDYFIDLVESIISQQLSEKAGSTIVARFYTLFPKKKPTPQEILALSDEKIRRVGTSWSKVSYIKNIARAIEKGDLHLKQLDHLTNAEVIKKLTKVKGVGQWTAEMFLMFSLGRPDVFSHGDLGLRRAIQKIYGFKREPARQTVECISRKWSPYRTYASRILWKSLDNE